MLDNKIFAFCFLISLPIAIIVGIIQYPRQSTESSVKKVANSAENGAIINLNDYWGNPIDLKIEKEAMRIIYTATSSGKDEKFGTKDDISHIAIDHNKSAIMACGLTQNVKEGIKGFWSGLKDKSDFKECQ